MARRNKPDVSSVLDELFPVLDGPQVDQDAVWIERSYIEPNPHQPRHRFDATNLRDLGKSLKTHGQLQACVVRPHPEKVGYFQLISGERRWRATGPDFGNISQVRCIIREANDAEMLQLALAENAHREDLSIIERAQALRDLKQSEPGFTWDDVATKANISKRRILHLVELLSLPSEVKNKLEDGTLNEKHGRALLSLQDDYPALETLLHKILKESLSGNQSLALVEQRRAIGTTAINNIAAHNESNSTPDAVNSKRGDQFRNGNNKPNGDQAKVGAATKGTRPAKSTQADPLRDAIRPARDFLKEATRQLEGLTLSVNYSHQVRGEIQKLRKQLDELEQRLTSQSKT